MSFRLNAGVILFALLSLPAHASGWYMGAGVGTATALNADNNVANALSYLAGTGIASVGSYDSNSFAGTLFWGFQFNRNFALELGYTDLGSYTLNVLATSGSGTVAASETDDVSAVSVSGVGMLPFGRVFSLFGKLGVASTADHESCAVTGTYCLSTTDYAVEPVVGVGGMFNVGRRWAFRLELDRYSQVGNSAFEYTAGDFKMLNFSALMRY